MQQFSTRVTFLYPLQNQLYLRRWPLPRLSSSVSHSTATPQPGLHIRKATLHDVQQINNCNRRNLPENYSNEFISNHISTWPLFSHVVECENNIAGYALGKVDKLESRENNFLQLGLFEGTKIVYIGHITSIAIEEPFRRSGVAAALMKTIHKQMSLIPNLQSINLLVRVSNAAAIQHYSKRHGYTCKHRLKQYYADGEDGWFMEWKRGAGVC